MSLENGIKHVSWHKSGNVGVGLRHPHYEEALKETSLIDFVEIHAENFFAKGGLSQSLLDEVIARYPVSLHSTSMGLGSAVGIDDQYLEKLKRLVDRIDPILVSDHACYTWSQFNNGLIHSGDLLPLEFSERSLAILVQNVDQVQQRLGRPILVENLSAYVDLGVHGMSETEFLSELVERSQCHLLIDLNNILVNANNFGKTEPLVISKAWLDEIPISSVAEIHLAGYTPAAPNELIIDDHSQPVSNDCWELYQYAIDRFGAITTLVEWDNQLPDWETLLAEAHKAKDIMNNLSDSIEGK